MIGTLMWIGDTTAEEFRGAVQCCLLNVSQLAFRLDDRDTVARPATDVRWIVFAQSNRHWFNSEQLIRRYPAAKAMTLLGPLCQGVGFNRVGECCDWQHWNEVLPEWLGIERPSRSRCRTVAVVASTLAAAEPLLELAESVGATAVWCRQPSRQGVRNVDAVWWDDSAAQPASEHDWRDRIEAFAGSGHRAQKGPPVQHAWVANSPTLQQARQARAAGVEFLVSKPHRIDSLLGMLDQPVASDKFLQVRAG